MIDVSSRTGGKKYKVFGKSKDKKPLRRSDLLIRIILNVNGVSG
jgi:hypothetical protein